jgi:hypothetical protein
MQPGKQAEIRPLGHGEGRQGEGFTDTTRTSSELPTQVVLEAPNDNTAVPVLAATNHGKVKKSQAKRSSDVVRQNSVDGEFHLDYSDRWVAACLCMSDCT